MIYAVLIIAAAALGLAAFAIFAAWTARGRAIDADRRIARHQQEHRSGLEDTGLRRHRAREEPSTEQLAFVRPDGAPERRVENHGPKARQSEPYGQLRRNRDDELGAATEEHPAPTGRFQAPPPALPTLPPPGRIDR